MKNDHIKQATHYQLRSFHCGRANSVHCDRLAAKVNVDARSIRHAIEALREDCVAVVGTPKTGYYIATTSDELKEGCAFLIKRAMGTLRLASRIKKISLPELLGQIQLNFFMEENT